MAPKNSHLALIYFLTDSSFLSIVPDDVMKAIIPPFLTLSIDFAKK